jgi:hypothetical protein
MTTDRVSALLRQRPAVHQLCIGSWLQAAFKMAKDVWAIPLKPLGFADEVSYLAGYAQQVVSAPVDRGAVQQLLQSSAETQPVVVLCVLLTIDASAKALEEASTARLSNARRVLSWCSASDVTPIGTVIATNDNTFFNPTPPSTTNRRILFGLGETESDFQAALLRIADRADSDERFAFALSLYHDSLKEENPEFRIARFFNVLEALAFKLKSSASPSRRAVKQLLGLADGATCHVRFEEGEYRFDAIEIAGRLRDRIFHGAPFEERDLNVESRPAFGLIRSHPAELAGMIRDYCELELRRWANGKSQGQAD